MRWNQLANDLPRAKALSNILCGAAMADGVFEDEEKVVVRAMLLKVLGASELPPEIETHLNGFTAASLNLPHDINVLGPENERSKKDLMGVTADVVKADRQMEPTELAYLESLATALGLDFADAF